MIITRTPFRISFFGGGTDYPAWYRSNSGAVLATTIDKYCYVSCRYLPPFFEHKHRLVYSKIENVKTVDEIVHPAVRAILTDMGCERGLEIHHDGDLPARSGLGSSSSFTVGLIHTLLALQGRYVSKEYLASEAIRMEQEVMREHVGSQDQVSAAYGGFNVIEFTRDDTFIVNPMIVSKPRLDDLQSHLMLFFTGLSRFASEVAKSKIDNFGKKERELLRMREMVTEAIMILQNMDAPITEFGELLAEGWEHKRSLSDKVSTPEIDEIYDTGRKAGAIGGKLLGAGGGGFLLLFAQPEKQPAILKALKQLVHVPFRFESAGSRVVLYQPNGL
ncbi:MAG: kinase [Betaproteobacteria bacterium]|nr:kinase [Betaproteobacteria bacterium]MBL8534593.1 kinase [Betaproteobacteria bacterium]